MRPLCPDWDATHPPPLTLAAASKSVRYEYAALSAPWASRCWRHYWGHKSCIRHRNWLVWELKGGLVNAREAALALLAASSARYAVFTHPSDRVSQVAVCVGGTRLIDRKGYNATSKELGGAVVNGSPRTDALGCSSPCPDDRIAFTIEPGVDPASVFLLPAVDHATTRFSNPHTALKLFGIAHARDVVRDELTSVLDADGTFVNPRHVALLADTMCVTGELLPMTRHGLARSGASCLSRASFETATKVLADCAVRKEIFKLEGVTERLVLGQLTKVGTNGASSMRLDEQALENSHCTATIECDYGGFSPYTNTPLTPCLDCSPHSPVTMSACWSPSSPLGAAPDPLVYSATAPAYAPPPEFELAAANQPAYA